MSVLDSLKAEYSELFQRYTKAVTYLDNPAIPNSDKEKWLPEFETLLKRLNVLFEKIEEDI